jgi:hypothetical protein
MSASDNRSDAGLKQFYSRSQQSSVKRGGAPTASRQSYADKNVVSFEQDSPDQMDVSFYSYVGTSVPVKSSEHMMRKRQESRMMKDRS